MSNKFSENASGAVNQQERLRYISPELGHYLAGFADGEGSFNISVIRRNSDYQHGWKISASFNISQKDAQIPQLFQETLKCGTIRFRRDGVCYFEVRTIKDLNTSVRAFFAQFPLLSTRQATRCRLLMEAITIMVKGEHLSDEGLEKILKIRELMISGHKRKYEITDILQNPQRLIRQTAEKSVEDRVPSAWRHAGSAKER